MTLPGSLVTADEQAMLDYYLIHAPGMGMGIGTVEAVVVEEFVTHPDHTTAGLRSARWASSDGCWQSAPSLSRRMRTDPELRGRSVPASRQAAALALGGGRLPREDALRSCFGESEPFTTSAPLRLGAGTRRHYRVLFAKDLDLGAVVAADWNLTADPAGPVVATGDRAVDGDRVEWEVRRIGGRIAWCLDVRGPADGPLLRELTAVLRTGGLIPVTTERFS